jgi:tetratricopeptide (TPR) repeat protein
MTTINKRIAEAIQVTRSEDYLRALTLFLDIYGTDDAPSLQSAKAAVGLSYFGLCLALVQKNYKTAVDLCRRAVELEFYNPDHFANLSRVYLAAGNRKRALETAESGLKDHPEHGPLLAARRAIGVRSRPPVPFLDRKHPVNVTLGQKRHAKTIAAHEKKTPKKK